MAANSEFTLVAEVGWRRGLQNLLRAGFASWWRTKSWWMHALIWSGVFCVMLAGILFTPDAAEAIDGVGFLCLSAGLFPTVAVVIILQGAIVGEKQNGTAEWLLSKPVSRTAYILGKILPNAVSMPVAMLLIPMLAGWVVINLAGASVTFLGLLGGVFIVTLNMLFYVSLTIMLGAMFSKRGGVIAIPLGLLFGQQYLIGGFPFLANVLPWALALPPGDDLTSSIAAAVMTGRPVVSWLPVFVALLATATFTLIAILRFKDVEL